jgi:Cu2+-exporting ATPase
VLVLPVMGFAVGPLAASAWRALRQRRLSMDVPVVLGIGVMFVASSIAMSGGDPAREVYFDSLAMFVAFLWGGRLLQLRLRHRAAEALENVAAALPQTALRVGEDGHVQRLPREELRRGDRVRVPRGAAVPADGCLLDERAELSEALLNGESRPAGKRRGDTVLAAAINRGPSFDLRVERIGADTRVAGIAALMQQTLSERPQHLGAADRIAGPFLAGVIVLAALAAAVWSWIEPSRAIGAAVAVLIATCPCALALASPATLAAGAAGLARRGLLPLRLRLFDRLLQVDRVFIDKTGTLTTDRPAWTATRLHTPVPPVLTEAAALHWAASMARSSLHPLAQALSDAAGDEGPPMPWAHLEETPGAGLQAMDAEGRRWRLGATDWADDSAVMADDAPRVVLACDGRRVASFEFDEALRPGAREAIAALQHAGLTLILLSGDRPARAQRLASRLGIGEVIAPASPEAKLAALKSAQARGHRVAMIGDGLNDAPVLAAADVAIAMGQGALLAQQAADGVVIGGRLDAIVQARSGVARSLRIQRQNLAWALAYNAACVPLAALGALPAWAAGIGMAASSVLVLLNAQRAANHA